MNKRLTFSKINRIVVLFLALIPVFVFVFTFLTSVIGRSDENLQLSTIRSYVDYDLELLNTHLLSSVRFLPWYSSLKTILMNCGFLHSNDGVLSLSFIIYNYLNYLILLNLLDLVFYSFTFFLSLIRSFVNKFGGEL